MADDTELGKAASTTIALLRSSPEWGSLLRPIGGEEVEFGAGGGFEFGGAFCAGKVVADAKGAAFDFVDAGEGFTRFLQR